MKKGLLLLTTRASYIDFADQTSFMILQQIEQAVLEHLVEGRLCQLNEEVGTHLTDTLKDEEHLDGTQSSRMSVTAFDEDSTLVGLEDTLCCSAFMVVGTHMDYEFDTQLHYFGEHFEEDNKGRGYCS